jgi:hypothetical protein
MTFAKRATWARQVGGLQLMADADGSATLKQKLNHPPIEETANDRRRKADIRSPRLPFMRPPGTLREPPAVDIRLLEFHLPTSSSPRPSWIQSRIFANSSELAHQAVFACKTDRAKTLFAGTASIC